MPPILGQPRDPPREGLREAAQDAGIALFVWLAIQFPGTELALAGADGSLILFAGASEKSGASQRAYSSVGLERTPDKREVGGSNPPRPTTLRLPAWMGL